MPDARNADTDFTRDAQRQNLIASPDSVEQLAQNIAESEADVAAGRVHPAEEVFTDIRQKLGLPE